MGTGPRIAQPGPKTEARDALEFALRLPVDDFARLVLTEARARGVELQWKPRFTWLSGKGHIEPAAQSAPSRTLDRLAAIHEALGGDPSLLRDKQRKEPESDFRWGEHTIVELDEFQHFSTARLRSLDFYDGFPVGFSVARYRRICNEHRARADKYRASKRAKDFPVPGSRTAQRAYMDAARDLLGPAIEYSVIRIPAAEEDVEKVVQELVAVLEDLAENPA